MRGTRRVLALIAVLVGSYGWTVLHFELLDSYPKKDQAVASAPIDITLIFSESADSARSSVTLQGPAGPVPLGPIRTQDEKLVLLTKVLGPMGAGTYTVAWGSAAPGEDPIRGSFRFTLR